MPRRRASSRLGRRWEGGSSREWTKCSRLSGARLDDRSDPVARPSNSGPGMGERLGVYLAGLGRDSGSFSLRRKEVLCVTRCGRLRPCNGRGGRGVRYGLVQPADWVGP
jgi:hypothetical protein